MAVNVAGLISIIVFYLLILVIGILAARKKNKNASEKEAGNEVILAGRSIGLIIGSFTMTATWVGGGYINGTAEAVYTKGLAWAQAPWGYALSLAFGGLMFAKKMRERGYVTMIDPLQEKYGAIMGGILYIPALLGETFWSASILAALGATLTVILGIDMNLSVVVSACIAVGYTFFGGLYSVAYTDVIQLICIYLGLWLCLPFALLNENVSRITYFEKSWLGKIKSYEVGLWIDYTFLLICGGIPWQVYFQRVLSSKSPGRAQILSFVAAAGCVILAVPAALVGAVAESADWLSIPSARSSVNANNQIKDTRLVLPMVLQHLTPTAVSFIGLGAVSAAVMSSADSSVLSASSMFAHNIYKIIFRPNASSREVIWVIRIGIFAVGALATAVGLTVKSIYVLFHLCSDLVFVILFPQLFGAVHIKFVNTYGSIAAFIMGLIFRLTGGESLIGLNAAIKYPGYKNGKQYFPFRLLAMLISFGTLLSVSYLFKYLLENEIISEDRDFLGVLARERMLAREEAKEEVHPMVPISNKKEDRVHTLPPVRENEDLGWDTGEDTQFMPRGGGIIV